ncbi:hypothetical protein B0H10DRAFT_2165954 [Mycena sp. CBHHK59/15]|nr:hypothetical protein B0H10DRAFT_2165954 [Mycena sp. CBHHK59/15]
MSRDCKHCGESWRIQGIRNHEKHCPRNPQKQQSQAYAEQVEQREASQVPPRRRHPRDQTPWAPFRTRLDFEVAEFVQDTMLNKNQINTLISLIRRCSENPDGFTIHNQGVLRHVTLLSYHIILCPHVLLKFQKSMVTVPYKTGPQTFEMYARPLWNWALDIVQDPHLADFFVWDAERDYIFNGDRWEYFFTEPWTAEAIKLLPFILYADKAKLSSFGTQKGYPMVARLGNVVVSLRNSSDWGGGQIVGWLPVVEEDLAQSGKPKYVNFKNAVWHAAFYKLLESIVMPSKTGFMTQCGDGRDRCLFPMILILAADYEEACVMALIRGLRALYPCPICYVKKDEQSNLSKTAKLRTSGHSQEILNETRALNADAKEALLKGHGLREVDNVFWNVAYSDPHQALSFEHLHAYSSGLWGKHLFEQIKQHAQHLGPRVAADIDAQFSAFPRWRNLNHFDSVMSTAFNDGSKHEDIAKMIILASHNILERDIDEYKNKISRVLGMDEKEKSWEFPKMHWHIHAFLDILRKGAARNFGTKIDEALHGSARNTYLRQINFKDVAPQILKSEHRTMVGKLICDQIDDIDEIQRCEWDTSDEGDEEPEGKAPQDVADSDDNVALGSRLPAISFGTLEEKMKADDTTFNRFRIKFSKFFRVFLHTYESQLQDGNPVNFASMDEIVPCQFLKIFYQSLEDWSDQADFLCCSPNFHRHPRFDGALVLTANGNIFVQLIYVFEFTTNGKKYPFALVQPLDAPVGFITAKEKDLKLFRVRAKPRQASEFIPVRSIIHGAVLMPNSKKVGEFFVMDVLEGDMFLRLHDMYRDRFQ